MFYGREYLSLLNSVRYIESDKGYKFVLNNKLTLKTNKNVVTDAVKVIIYLRTGSTSNIMSNKLIY